MKFPTIIVSVMTKVLWIAFAGALGTSSRYLLATLVQRLAGGNFPWGTMIVNMLGTFAFGAIWSLAEERLLLSAETRAIVLTGFMGAFTTFSTFIFESGGLLRQAQWALVAGNIVASIIVGIAFLFIGLAAGRVF